MLNGKEEKPNTPQKVSHSPRVVEMTSFAFSPDLSLFPGLRSHVTGQREREWSGEKSLKGETMGCVGW